MEEVEELSIAEQKLIAWQSEESETEGFKTVSYKKKMERKKKGITTVVSPHPADGESYPGEDVHMISSRYNLRKGTKIKNIAP